MQYEKLEKKTGIAGLPIKPKDQTIEISGWFKQEPDSKAKINESDFFDLKNDDQEKNSYFENTSDMNSMHMKQKTGKGLQAKASLQDDSTYGKEEKMSILNISNRRPKIPDVKIIKPGMVPSPNISEKEEGRKEKKKIKKHKKLKKKKKKSEKQDQEDTLVVKKKEKKDKKDKKKKKKKKHREHAPLE